MVRGCDTEMRRNDDGELTGQSDAEVDGRLLNHCVRFEDVDIQRDSSDCFLHIDIHSNVSVQPTLLHEATGLASTVIETGCSQDSVVSCAFEIIGTIIESVRWTLKRGEVESEGRIDIA